MVNVTNRTAIIKSKKTVTNQAVSMQILRLFAARATAVAVTTAMATAMAMAMAMVMEE